MVLNNKLPIGIQDFEKIREENYLYVDKTDYIYDLVNSGSYYFLCRPRFFGKTLLLSAIENYFRGRKDLFVGLKIAELEQDWQEYPVMHLDFSTDLYNEEWKLEETLNIFLTEYEHRYGKHEERSNYAKRFEYIIHRIYETSGKPVVVLIDNYDKPILDALFTDNENHSRDLLRNFYSVLNGNDYYIKFALLTGISKFASVNIFNGSNQFRDISLDKNYSSICGFTPDELNTNFSEHISESNFSIEKLIKKYGNYCFSKNQKKVLNPYSVLSSLASGEMNNFWVNTGLPTILIKMLLKNHYNLFNLIDGLKVDAEDLMEYRWTDSDMISLIYQSGYLSINSYDSVNNIFNLSIPNEEVKYCLLRSIVPYFTRIGSVSKFGAEVAVFREYLQKGDILSFISKFVSIIIDEEAISSMKESSEYVYKIAFSIILKLTGFIILDDFGKNTSHSDIIVCTEGDIYIFSIRMDKNLFVEDVIADTLAHITEQDYGKKFADTNKKIHKVAIILSSSKGGIAGWKID